MNFLFLAKEKPFAKDAANVLLGNFPNSTVLFGKLGDKLPKHILENKFDYTISYISPWIVPQKILSKTQIASINLHPGPPEYPGIGCTNFAIYNQEKEFGITAHHMVEKIDSGQIITVKRFPLFEADSVWSLSQRCYAFIYITFIELLQVILTQSSLPVSEEIWSRKPYTRKDLNELCKVSSTMTKEEILRRIKATSFPNMPGAYIEISGEKFIHKNYE